MVLRLPAAALLTLCLGMAWTAARHIPADYRFSLAEAELTFWGRDDYQPNPGVRQRTAVVIEGLLEGRPHHPDYWTLRAGQLAWEAWWSEDDSAALQLQRDALAAQWQSLLYRPAYRAGWATLARYAEAAEDGDTAAEALARETALGRATRYN